MSWEQERPLFPQVPAPTETLRPRNGQQKRAAAGWTLVVISLVAALVLALIPVPYVIEQPGPVFNTLGTTTHDGQEVPLITIEGAQTYPTSGSLDMLTVSIVGRPSARPSWIEVVGAWFDPARAVLPLDAVYPPSVTEEQQAQRNQLQMVSSQQDAVAAALTELGVDVVRTLTVVGVTDDMPAAGILEEGDVVTAVNAKPVTTVAALREVLAVNGTERPARISVERDGVPQDFDVVPVAGPEGPVFGITLQPEYEFPYDVEIQLDNVGGPSAGMMFALGIIDSLTPGELTGGANVAGTGTITPDGVVGSIGGIRQKMYGAKRAGAEYFLAPTSNCNEVTGHVPNGLRVFAVETLDDALAVLGALTDGSDLDALPTCS